MQPLAIYCCICLKKEKGEVLQKTMPMMINILFVYDYNNF